ncbi:hypothetical protein LSH36_7g02014 [Paralvinella palmiformis]|uniref:Inner membrane component domain-containing protein n=1 Tax=Paralvinella palmiformis TaxID=53620 RepID=A0AAD9NH01_9ANNE|nr:hypothetical protein LSH36_7g02014 [Paralvinella palmiformis]
MEGQDDISPSGERTGPAGSASAIEDTGVGLSPPKTARIENDFTASTETFDGSTSLRHRGFGGSLSQREMDELNYAADLDYVVMNKPENEMEARRMVTNYLFGFRKWKSHVTQRPLEERSELVQQLYKDDARDTVNVRTVGNIVYVILYGWWVALIYLLLAFFMLLTIIGLKYSKYCFKLACYFIWPFGKFVHQNIPNTSSTNNLSSGDNETALEEETLLSFHSNYNTLEETTSLLSPQQNKQNWRNQWNHKETHYWVSWVLIIHLGKICSAPVAAVLSTV